MRLGYGNDVATELAAVLAERVSAWQGVESGNANGMNTGPGGTVPTRQDPWPPQAGEVNTRHFF